MVDTVGPTTGRTFHCCSLNNIQVNKRMHCEEWSDGSPGGKAPDTNRQFVGAVSVSGITTEKKNT